MDSGASLVARGRKVSTVCKVLGVARSNVHQRAHWPCGWVDGRKGRQPAEDAALVAEIRTEIATLPTYGYRRAGELVRRRRTARGLPPVNHKRIYRVMRTHGLLLARAARRGADRRHAGRIAVARSDLRWCSDALEIVADNGECVRMALSLACCDRSTISWVAVANAAIDGAMVRDMMLEAVERRFGMPQTPAPIEWLSDNGSPYVAEQTQVFAADLGLVPRTTPIESPQSNGMAEAFVNTLRRDYVSVNPTPDAPTIRRSLPYRIEHYNEHHPHSALGMRSPRMFRREQALRSESPCPEIRRQHHATRSHASFQNKRFCQ